MMDLLERASHFVGEVSQSLIHEIRVTRRAERLQAIRRRKNPTAELTFGQKIADAVAAIMGSWNFIIVQSIALSVWVVLNVSSHVKEWDPYPFILLNLALSFQAAYAAPVIMMSQNRQQDIDRKALEEDFKINIKTELELELLHQKFDRMRQEEILTLTNTVAELTRLLHESIHIQGNLKAPQELD